MKLYLVTSILGTASWFWQQCTLLLHALCPVKQMGATNYGTQLFCFFVFCFLTVLFCLFIYYVFTSTHAQALNTQS